MDNLQPRQFGFIQHDQRPEGALDMELTNRRTEKINPASSEIHTTQDFMYPDKVQKFEHSGMARMMGGRPEIANVDGQMWVQDGHHRLAAAMRRGTDIKVNMVDARRPASGAPPLPEWMQ